MTTSGLVVAAITDIGCKRKNNEDSILSLPECGLFCVADGMGGAREGQVASKALTDALRKEFTSKAAADMDLPAKSKLLREVVDQVNAWIQKRAEERGFAQMGSTVVSALFDEKHPNQGIALHAGDSRLYSFRRRTLKQLTADHSFAAALAAQSGGICDESAIPPAWRGVVTKAVGKLGDSDKRQTVDLDEVPFDIRPGDLFILCSDGLTRMLSDKVLQDLLCQNDTTDVEVLAKNLVEAAKKAGGIDNISLILIKVPGGDTADSVGVVDAPTAQPEPDTATPPTPQYERQAVAKAMNPKEASDEKETHPSVGKDIVEGDTPHSGEFSKDLEKALSRPRRGRPLSKALGLGALAVTAVLAAIVFTRRSLSDKTVSMASYDSANTSAMAPISTPPVPPVSTNTTVPPPAPVEVAAIATQTPVMATAIVVAAVSTARVPGGAATSTAGTGIVSGSVSGVVAGIQIPATNVPDSMSVVSVNVTKETNEPSEVASPVSASVSLKSEDEKRKEAEEQQKAALRNAQQVLALGLTTTLRTGKWGDLKRQLGAWADKLDQLEPNKDKREAVQAWMKKWNDARVLDSSERAVEGARQMQSLVELLGVPRIVPDEERDAMARADGYCRSCYTQQVLLVKGIQVFADRQEQQLQSLGKQLEVRLTSLSTFLEDASSAKALVGVCASLEGNEKRCKDLRSWAQSHSLGLSPLMPEDYPKEDIKALAQDADAAWDDLFKLIKPAGQQIAQLPASMESLQTMLTELHWKIVRSRQECATVRQWRTSETGALIGKFLEAVDAVVRLLPPPNPNSK